MNTLREPVTVHAPGGDMQGDLIVGRGGLPEFVLKGRPDSEGLTNAAFPAAWRIVGADNERIAGPLLAAWLDVESVRRYLALVQREAEAEEQ